MSRQAHGIDKGKENSKLLLHHDNKETPNKDSQVETPQVQEREQSLLLGTRGQGGSETSFGKQAATGNCLCCWICRSDLNKVLASLHRAAVLSSVAGPSGFLVVSRGMVGVKVSPLLPHSKIHNSKFFQNSKRIHGPCFQCLFLLELPACTGTWLSLV